MKANWPKRIYANEFLCETAFNDLLKLLLDRLKFKATMHANYQED